MAIKKLDGTVKGRLFLNEVEFDKIRTAIIGANNKTSGKISLPFDEIGQTVYILYPKQEAGKHD